MKLITEEELKGCKDHQEREGRYTQLAKGRGLLSSDGIYYLTEGLDGLKPLSAYNPENLPFTSKEALENFIELIIGDIDEIPWSLYILKRIEKL